MRAVLACRGDPFDFLVMIDSANRRTGQDQVERKSSAQQGSALRQAKSASICVDHEVSERCARRDWKIQDGGQLIGDIRLPKGQGPFPFIVLLHGCTGLAPGDALGKRHCKVFWSSAASAFGARQLSSREAWKRSCGEGDYRWAVRRARGRILGARLSSGTQDCDPGKGLCHGSEQRWTGPPCLRWTHEWSPSSTWIRGQPRASCRTACSTRAQYYAPFVVFATSTTTRTRPGTALK